MTVANIVLRDWNSCVRKAKKKLGIPLDSFVLVKGKLLKETQKRFCAMGY